jgi:type VI secretion system secreted protein VgrG
MVSQLSNAAVGVSQQPRISLVFENGEDSLSVVEFSVHERMNAPFEVTLTARSPHIDIDLEGIVGHAAGFGYVAGDLEVVAWTGVCAYMEQVQAEATTTGLSTYRLILVAPIWLLTQRRGHRIFQHLSVPDVVRKILAEYRIDAAWELDDTYPEREFEVQYDETDFAFVTRLLEEAGISYWFEKVGSESRSETKLTFTDHPQKAPSIGEIDFYDQPNRTRNKKFVTSVRIAHDVKPGKTTWRDYDFRKPQLALMESSSLGLQGDEAVELAYERYHFGQGVSLIEVSPDGATPVADEHGAARNEPGELEARAQRAAEAERHAGRRVEFDTNEKDLVPGTVFSIAQHPHDEIAPDKPLLVVETILRGDIGDWSLVGVAVFTEPGYRYRPALRTKKPRVMGYQTAIVVGPPGKEIHADEYGRVRVRFHWDRENDFDDGASCWLRVSQPWAGAGFGWTLVPRVGQEVIVDFFGGDPNQPVVVGRLHNMTSGPPRVLPKHMTQSSWRSATSPYADACFNEIMMDDEQGKELVFVQAQRDLYKLVKRTETERTGGDRTIVVGAARVTAIAANETQQVGERHLVAVVSAGDLHIPDMGDPEVTPKATFMETVDGRITLTTGNATVVLDGADIRIDAEGALRFSADGQLIMKASDIYLNEEDAGAADRDASVRVSDPVDEPDRILPAVAKLAEPPQTEEIDTREDVQVQLPGTKRQAEDDAPTSSKRPKRNAQRRVAPSSLGSAAHTKPARSGGYVAGTGIDVVIGPGVILTSSSVDQRTNSAAVKYLNGSFKGLVDAHGKQWIAGHILNANFGGSGTAPQNVMPLTTTANHAHDDAADKPIKTLLTIAKGVTAERNKDDYYGVRMSVRVLEHGPPSNETDPVFKVVPRRFNVQWSFVKWPKDATDPSDAADVAADDPLLRGYPNAPIKGNVDIHNFGDGSDPAHPYWTSNS